ncbi:lycopene cyclase family protein [Saccharopolyspora phatthalungensis]|uniref:Lycopene beta-cyclase n=1 Tax=Saccharopolyspora phatthalungensis TaxID=664693 RepID=A0A840Q1K2_9PSEU|nr:lycopene cyclase family protein [Saccharopolyspora phatthalungensis]MBB5152668.1 lycopene beta-cyclase [Saccharopolyspora phatthalungensis]
MDVVVVGGGPAGRAAAAACSDTGLRVTLVDPAPRRGWPHTYGAWHDELPASVPSTALAAVQRRMSVHGTGGHEWQRPYAVLDNTALWKRLWRADVVEVTGRAMAAEHGPTGSTVVLKDGRRIAAAVVVDATGAARALCGGRPAHAPAQQSAVGWVVNAAAAEPFCGPDTGVFMDWRPAPQTRGGWPTFLYAVHLGPDRVLLEETSLARRPALPLALLRRRLAGRLAAAGLGERERIDEERVRFPVDDPLPRPGRVIPFGAAAGFVHPATGFSVAASLRSAPWLAATISAALPAGPAVAARAGWSILWPTRAVTAHVLRHRALQALLSLPPELVPEFFETFFRLDEPHRRAFLASDGGAAETAAAMSALFRNAPWRIRRRLVLGSLSIGHPAARHGLGGS